MGKADQRQANISFDGGRKKGGAPTSQPEEKVVEEGTSDMSVKAMFLDLKNSLAEIDGKLDHLTEQMERIEAQVDDHDSCFEQLEARTSGLEDQRHEYAQTLRDRSCWGRALKAPLNLDRAPVATGRANTERPELLGAGPESPFKFGSCARFAGRARAKGGPVLCPSVTG
ncbi:hypothetical protein NDU88_008289 [Pleurodeles waltl]|uniref:t-SNARE coiled-coil homology domain-containing protein n=1 Tax=Pleurodeles waltl TaxID=8319 RepID=A0AAV7PPZ0_PLEWA|nr:hypothetical protein NDU88_008289 [Pleurodeles waltl]